MADNSDGGSGRPKSLRPPLPTFERSRIPGDALRVVDKMEEFCKACKNEGHREDDVVSYMFANCFEGYAKTLVEAEFLAAKPTVLAQLTRFVKQRLVNPGDKDKAASDLHRVKQGAMSCEEYFCKFTEHYMRAKLVEYEISDDEANRLFLQGLNPTWRNLALSTTLHNLVWTELGVSLVRREALMGVFGLAKHQGENNPAGSQPHQQNSSGRSGGGGGFGGYNNNQNRHNYQQNKNKHKKHVSGGNASTSFAAAGGAGQGGGGGASSSSTQASSATGGVGGNVGVCWLCKNPGHFARECPTKKRSK